MTDLIHELMVVLFLIIILITVNRSNLSSRRPTIDNGMQNNGMKCLFKIPLREISKTNIIPPAVGFGIICELLLFGSIKKNFFSIGINEKVKRKVKI